MSPTSAILRAGIIFKLSIADADADGAKLSTTPGIATYLYSPCCESPSATHNAVRTEFDVAGGQRWTSILATGM